MSEAATNKFVPSLTVRANDESLTSREESSPTKRPQLRSHERTIYQCRICHHSYQRADRLSRHLKSHENARRYICHVCQKGFNRADLLGRHVLTHKRKKASTGSEALTNIHRAERTLQACFACATAKARCEEQKPCQRCRARNIECEIPGLLTSSQGTENEQPPNCNDQSCTDLGWENPSTACPRKDFSEQQPQDRQNFNPYITPEAQPSTTIDSEPSVGYSDSQAQSETSSTFMDPLLATIDPYNMHIAPFCDSQLVYESAFENVMFTPNVPHFNYQNVDLNFSGSTFLDNLYNPFPSFASRTTNNQAATIEASERPLRPTRDIRAGREAFARSPWLFNPALRDYIFRDAEDLTLDENNISSALSLFWSITPDTLSNELPVFNTAKRDEMHYLISTVNTYTHRIPRFPSLDILNDLARAFLTRHASQIDSWLHMPMLRSSETISELNLALIMSGSTVGSISSLSKLGHVLQDVVRVKLGELCERQNSAVRKLQPLLAWMLLLDAGLWSGFQRQMELSESFEKTVVTMVRRGGMFGASTDAQSLIPLGSDEGPVLENKWKKWVQREAFKRLCIHLFLHDTQASIALHKCPIISATEITFSLPAPHILYQARSATEWKSYFYDTKLSLSKPALKLVDIARDPGLLEDLGTDVDVPFCCKAAIHTFWGQIWAFREAWKFHSVGDTKNSVHHLWLVTQQRELYQQMQTFRTNLLRIQGSQAELLITIELFLMIMHVSPDELECFAGKHGEDAAAQAIASLERWYGTEQSRRAVWHAGQVFRWATQLNPTDLRDFYAVAVYHAGILLWVYGHLSLSSRETNNNPSNKAIKQSAPGLVNAIESTTTLVINGEESDATKTYIAGRPINPILSHVWRQKIPFDDAEVSAIKFIQLEDPNAILKMARDLYQNNFPVESKILPPLVNNLGNLMRDLAEMSEKRFSRCASPTVRGRTVEE